VAQAIAAIDVFLAELRARRAATRDPGRIVRHARRRLLRQLARPGRN